MKTIKLILMMGLAFGLAGCGDAEREKAEMDAKLAKQVDVQIALDQVEHTAKMVVSVRARADKPDASVAEKVEYERALRAAEEAMETAREAGIDPTRIYYRQEKGRAAEQEWLESLN